MNTQHALDKIEIHIRALAAAAAQAQLAFGGSANKSTNRRGAGEWSDRYDTLARNLAEPALDELDTLRRVLQANRAPALKG